MNHDITVRLAEARQLRDAQEECLRKLPEARDVHGRESHRLQHLELCLDTVGREIGATESMTIGGLLDRLFGRKESKVAALREEVESLQAEYDECERALGDAEAAVQRIEAELASLGDAEEAYARLYSEAREAILAGGHAVELTGIAEDLAAWEEHRRRLTRTVEIGRHAMERLHSVTGAVGRARNKMTYQHGVIGALTVNKAARQGSAYALRRAAEGVDELCRCVDALGLDESVPIDAELLTLRLRVGEEAATLSGRSAEKWTCDPRIAAPLVETVQAMIGHLESKVDSAKQAIGALAAQERELVEGAVVCGGESNPA